MADLGRVLINAQIAAPLFLGHNHRLFKKFALTTIVDQAYNSNERPLPHGPTAKPPFGSR
jgi:hypothetical protein